MKRVLITFILILSISLASFAQPYFQGSFSLGTNDTVVFKMKPVFGNITTTIAYMEFAFKYITTQAPGLSTSAPVSNTAFFGSGLSVSPFPPDFVDGNFTYIKFIHNTATLASKTYVNGTEYEIFKVKLSITPTAVMGIEMASDLSTGNYVFGIVDGSGQVFDPGANDQFYGNGYYTDSPSVYLPLIASTLPIKFLSFNAKNINDNGVLNWAVANENAQTKLYQLERSNDGRNFSTIASINPKYNGSNNTYDYTDFNLKSIKSEGVIFYRVKEIDQDNKFVYSYIQPVKLNNKLALYLSPNPAISNTILTYELASSESIQISITDDTGKVVNKIRTEDIKGVNQFNIDLNNYTKGIYLVSLKSNSSSIKTLPLIKQ